MQATDTDSGRAVYWGTGRRKCAIARVRLVPGTGQMIVNGKPGDLYFQFNPNYLAVAKAPLDTLGLENEYDILVKAEGPLKTEGYLTRDPRAKERKKYGLHKARKAPQYSKR